MVVDDAAGLHGGVGGDRAGEGEAVPLELGAERLGGRRGRAARRPASAAPRPGSPAYFQTSALSPSGRSSAARALAITALILARFRTMPGVGHQPGHVLRRRRPRPPRGRIRRRRRGSSPACARWSARTARTGSPPGRAARRSPCRRAPGGPTPRRDRRDTRERSDPRGSAACRQDLRPRPSPGPAPGPAGRRLIAHQPCSSARRLGAGPPLRARRPAARPTSRAYRRNPADLAPRAQAMASEGSVAASASGLAGREPRRAGSGASRLGKLGRAWLGRPDGPRVEASGGWARLVRFGRLAARPGILEALGGLSASSSGYRSGLGAPGSAEALRARTGSRGNLGCLGDSALSAASGGLEGIGGLEGARRARGSPRGSGAPGRLRGSRARRRLRLPESLGILESLSGSSRGPTTARCGVAARRFGVGVVRCAARELILQVGDRDVAVAHRAGDAAPAPRRLPACCSPTWRSAGGAARRPWRTPGRGRAERGRLAHRPVRRRARSRRRRCRPGRRRSRSGMRTGTYESCHARPAMSHPRRTWRNRLLAHVSTVAQPAVRGLARRPGRCPRAPGG